MLIYTGVAKFSSLKSYTKKTCLCVITLSVISLPQIVTLPWWQSLYVPTIPRVIPSGV